MKYLILSDIHGSLTVVETVLRQFEQLNCDMLLLLGDLLNYGPRNGLAPGLDPQGVAQQLNAMADRTICVRGNCDSEVDQMLLDFPILDTCAHLVDEGRHIILTYMVKKSHPAGISICSVRDILTFRTSPDDRMGRLCSTLGVLPSRKGEIRLPLPLTNTGL